MSATINKYKSSFIHNFFFPLFFVFVLFIQAAIIRSEGDAEAAQLVSDALQKAGDGLLELRRIETALNVANTLSHARNVTYLPGGQNSMVMLPPPVRTVSMSSD